MKVKLENPEVELTVSKGKSVLYINGQKVADITREAGIQLVFGQGPVPPVTARKGCQTFESKKRLSASLKAYYADKKKREGKAKAKPVVKAKPSLIKHVPSTKKLNPKLNGKSHLNGAAAHVN